MLVVLNKLDHEPLEDDGDESGGATTRALVPGGVPRDHTGDIGLCRSCGKRL